MRVIGCEGRRGGWVRCHDRTLIARLVPFQSSFPHSGELSEVNDSGTIPRSAISGDLIAPQPSLPPHILHPIYRSTNIAEEIKNCKKQRIRKSYQQSASAPP